MTHTPTPWRWWTSNSFLRLSSDVTGKDGDVLSAVTQGEDDPVLNISDADAEFIVRACNAHDELVTAADAMLAELLFRAEGYRSIPLSAAGKALRAALAKAKAQT